MAKLLVIDENNEKRKRLLGGLVFIVSLAVLLGAMVVIYNLQDDKTAFLEEIPPIYVHVKGAVGESGLCNVPYGTRVNDLSGYVGGFLPEADLEGVNLAGFVKDGEEIYIPFKGSPERGGYNLNTVTEEELFENVEGIGKTYARKIVEYRESRGGFKTVGELKGIVGESVYEKVREKFYIE